VIPCTVLNSIYFFKYTRTELRKGRLLAPRRNDVVIRPKVDDGGGIDFLQRIRGRVSRTVGVLIPSISIIIEVERSPTFRI
jgi:hypothetical protein